MKSAYAMHKDLGPLVGDPNFGTLAKMFAGSSMTGSSVDGTIKSVLPGLDSSADQRNLLYADSTQPEKFGTKLEKLIPDPAIYKFETGTGFEVRPVVQPDCQSVVFDFNYMYTTDLLEPTSPDERSLGRVKRHFVDTEVQLGNLEWREISRYEVALKAARNSRGVTLLEDIPLVGLAFRPLPQAKKSIQKNVIVCQAAIYPTIEDLLGLKSPAAAGLNTHELGPNMDTLALKQRNSAETVDQLLASKLVPFYVGPAPAMGYHPYHGTPVEVSPGTPIPPTQEMAPPAPMEESTDGDTNAEQVRGNGFQPAISNAASPLFPISSQPIQHMSYQAPRTANFRPAIDGSSGSASGKPIGSAPRLISPSRPTRITR